jgi:antitoxin component YwqK of YwqJK toxin-antitoxin module
MRKKQRNPSLLVLMLAIATLGLSGCSNEELDYRNVQVVNGKIYSGDSNKPFTGSVTNVPDNEILKSQDGFAGFANIIVQAAFSSDMQAARNLGITGVGMLTASATAYCDVSVHDGLLDGKAICKAPRSDTVGTEMSFKDGSLTGSMKYFDFDLSPNPLAEGSFEDGVPDGKQTVYDAKTGSKIAIVHWASGVQDGTEEIYNRSSGEVTKKLSYKNGKIDGDYVEYSASGKIKLHTAELTNGVKNGNEALYYPDTGKRKEYSEWKDGNLNGTVRRWDENGNETQEMEFKNGLQVQKDKDQLVQALADSISTPASMAASNANLDSCVQAWTVAYRKEQGVDAMVASDQLDEWKQWCQQGKQAPSN